MRPNAVNVAHIQTHPHVPCRHHYHQRRRCRRRRRHRCRNSFCTLVWLEPKFNMTHLHLPFRPIPLPGSLGGE